MFSYEVPWNGEAFNSPNVCHFAVKNDQWRITVLPLPLTVGTS